MRDVTDFFHRYRLMLRSIWNEGFWADPECRDDQALSAFRALKKPLFDAMAFAKLDITPPSESLFGEDFLAAPRDGDQRIDSALIDTSERPELGSGIWQPLKLTFEGAILVPVDVFDWFPFRFADLRHYICVVRSWPAHPEHVGRFVVVDVDEVRISLNPRH